MEKIRIKEAIVVEGRYDKNTVSQIVDATVLETEGFGIFSDKEKLALLRSIAEKRGLIILTDSDAAGFMIRNHLKGAISPDKIKHAYIPDVFGKEKRKKSVSKEGKIGVEGMKRDVVINALKAAGASFEDGEKCEKRDEISKTDLYVLGLSGGENSAQKRSELIKKLGLPERLSSSALLDVLNALFTLQELEAVLGTEILDTGGTKPGNE